MKIHLSEIAQYLSDNEQLSAPMSLIKITPSPWPGMLASEFHLPDRFSILDLYHIFVLSLTIAAITVSWQALKASRMNPAASIRAE